MSAILVKNAIECPDGTIIQSTYRHDYVSHTQEDGRTYAVDGGLVYSRIVASDKKYTNLCVYSDDPHEIIRENMTWGSYGKNADQPLTVRLLKELSNDHIDSVIEYLEKKYPDEYSEQIKIFREERSYRYVKNIKVPEYDV